MMIGSRITRRCSAVALCVVIVQWMAACTPTTVARTPATGAPKANEGVVIVSVTGNTGRVAAFQTLELAPIVRSSSSTGLQSLSNVATGLARDTALFIGIVPAGDYALRELNDGFNYVVFGDGPRQLVGDIHVDAGAVADLGRIVMTPATGDKVLTGRSTRVTSNEELIRTFSPANAAVLSQRLSGGWKWLHTSMDRVEKDALRWPVGADTPMELPSGEVIAASRMGTLLIRSTNGQWRARQTGELASLLSVLPVTKGRVDEMDAIAVGVGELNTIVCLDNQEKLWRLNPGNLPPGNLLSIQGNASDGWYIAHKQPSEIVVYHSPRLDNASWEPIRREKSEYDFWFGPGSFWIWSTEGGFNYALSEGRIEHFDFASKTWTQHRTPKNDRIISLKSTAKTIGILTSPAGGLSGFFSSMYLSYDDGKSWESIKSPYKAKLEAPLGLADGSVLLSGGGLYAARELQVSTDKSQTWHGISSDVSPNDVIVPLPTQGLLAIDSGTRFGRATIRHSGDGGKTWTLEYFNSDR